ncbi:helicase conserved C-terminal domain-containing protein, putative [Eimeria tenella]|uniref:Helicase conserved C-terminal domain-containing protein, putative n=1 Tax=Eimeria tenella TaxID=5802 RepID=U6KKL7_EIMTE|nr:helicase conserved C-terminal domain-containing protein, putative [Eimeria tenella]CDJ38580.1 helicase conserved C-terminal domain-containing protein, putative [Eimeria tenella]|eukprot:XP_013229418.1 helicase conserved C-terminal domain-containing protein, putative [Eimeria tenella]
MGTWPRGAPLPQLWALHSGLSAEKRLAVVNAFKSSSKQQQQQQQQQLKVLFCTDVAAVGVQLGTPALALQIGAPKDPDLYIQRVSRAPR